MKWLKNLFSRKQSTRAAQGPVTTLAFVITDPMPIERLRQRGNHPDNRDLINTALTVYKWSLDAIEEGRIIASVNETDSSYRVLSTPRLDDLKNQIPWGTWEE